MDERWSAGNALYVEPHSMTPAPAVRCCDCSFAWNSAAMADGLRVLGHCPKCGGDLEFSDGPEAQQRSPEAPERFTSSRTAPHLVLGIPRR
jgi:hypothetical protein